MVTHLSESILVNPVDLPKDSQCCVHMTRYVQKWVLFGTRARLSK